jgi:hypothetical protein
MDPLDKAILRLLELVITILLIASIAYIVLEG